MASKLKRKSKTVGLKKMMEIIDNDLPEDDSDISDYNPSDPEKEKEDQQRFYRCFTVLYYY